MPASGSSTASADKLESEVIAGNWNQLAELTPENAVGHFVKAAANGILGNYRFMYDEFKRSRGGEASIEQFCQKLVQQAPKNGHVHFVDGIRLYDKGETEKALALYKKATALSPKFASPYVQIALHYGQKMHNSTEQMSWLDKALAADPDYVPAYVAKGKALLDSGKQEAGISLFKKAVALLEAAKVTQGQPMGQAYYNLGWVCINQSPPDNDKGIELMRKAIAADPLTLEAYNELGIALKRKGKFAEAAETYKNGINKGANDAMIYFNLGVAEQKNGNSSDAKVAFSKAVSLDPGGNAGNLAQQWLKQIQ